MIGKVIKGRSFKGCISYVLGKDEAKLLDADGVLLTDVKSIINSFYLQSRMNPKLSRCVGHIPLSYSPYDKERMTDEFMIRLAKEYMKGMKIENTQYIIVRHQDREHPHCHIIFNRIDNNGKTISEKNDYARNEKVTKALKEKYGLYFGKGKEQVNQNRLNEPDKTRYELHTIISQALKQTKTWKQFADLLDRNGVEIKFKYKGNSNQVQGISFMKEGYSFKGSDVDRNFSFGKLNKQFTTIKQKQTMRQKPQVNQIRQPTTTITENVLDGLENIPYHAYRDLKEDEEVLLRKRKKKRKSRSL